MRTSLLLLLVTFSFSIATSIQALTLEPYPPPGSPTFTNLGTSAASAGGSSWQFTAWNTAEYAELYLGPGYREAGLDGAPGTALAFSGISGTTATWTGTTNYNSPGGPGNLPAGAHTIDLILNAEVVGYGANPWQLSGPVDNVEVLDPGIGAVVDITAGLDFIFNMEILAVLPGIGTVALNDVAQGPPGGQTVSSIGSHWFVAAVPEPGTAVLFSLGLMGLASRRRR